MAWASCGEDGIGNHASYLAITAEHNGQRSVLRLNGELDITNEGHLRLAVSVALARHPALLVVDLSALRFMDCSGLSVLAEASRRLAGSRHPLLITNVQPMVRRLISLRGLDTHLLSGTAPSGLTRSMTPGEGLPLTGASA